MPAPIRTGLAGKLKQAGGRLVSAKSKTQKPECSQAMSTWKTSGMTPMVASILGKCRAMAHALKSGGNQRAAGNEAKAQVLEHRAATGKVGVKARLEQARTLRAARARKAEPPAAPTNRKGEKTTLGHGHFNTHEEAAKAYPVGTRIKASVGGVEPSTYEVTSHGPASRKKGLSGPTHIVARLKHVSGFRDRTAKDTGKLAFDEQYSGTKIEVEHAPAKLSARQRVGQVVRQSEADKAAGRFPGLESIKPGTPYRQSQFRPKAGTPKYREHLAQAKLGRDFKRSARADKHAAAPKADATKFALKQDSTAGAKRTLFGNNGKSTPTFGALDIKKGDLKGQASIFDKPAPAKAHGRGTPERKAQAAAIQSARRINVKTRDHALAQLAKGKGTDERYLAAKAAKEARATARDPFSAKIAERNARPPKGEPSAKPVDRSARKAAFAQKPAESPRGKPSLPSAPLRPEVSSLLDKIQAKFGPKPTSGPPSPARAAAMAKQGGDSPRVKLPSPQIATGRTRSPSVYDRATGAWKAIEAGKPIPVTPTRFLKLKGRSPAATESVRATQDYLETRHNANESFRNAKHASDPFEAQGRISKVVAASRERAKAAYRAAHPKAARPDLKSSVAAHRAAKGDRAQRLGTLLDKNRGRMEKVGVKSFEAQQAAHRLRREASDLHNQTPEFASKRHVMSPAEKAKSTRMLREAERLGSRAYDGSRDSRKLADRHERMVDALVKAKQKLAESQGVRPTHAAGSVKPTSLRDQAAAHRATKGDRAARLKGLYHRSVETWADSARAEGHSKRRSPGAGGPAVHAAPQSLRRKSALLKARRERIAAAYRASRGR